MNKTALKTIVAEVLLKNTRSRLITNYVERNTYVRVITGLPSLNDNEFVYVDSVYSYLVNTTLPVHKLSDSELEILYVKGVLTTLVEKFPSK